VPTTTKFFKEMDSVTDLQMMDTNLATAAPGTNAQWKLSGNELEAHFLFWRLWYIQCNTNMCYV